MRSAAAVLAALLMAGCGPGSREQRLARPSFRLIPPGDGRVAVLNGTSRTFEVKVSRRHGFAGPVFLRLELLPEAPGVRARLAAKVVEPPPAPQKVIVTVTVSETARAGEFTVRLVGRAESGAGTTAEILFRVPRRD